MRFTAVLLLTACLQVSAASFSQKVTISRKNAPLEKVLNEIKKQTGYNFVYTNGIFKTASNVSVDVDKASIEEVLAICFKDQPLSYTIIEKIVVVKYGVTPSAENRFTDIFIDVTGRVIDENGQPVVGATINVKGSSLYAATNEKGTFTLRGVTEGATIVVTGISIQRIEIKLGNNSNIGDILVKTKAIDMSDFSVVANTGYQTVSRERSTGSFGVINKAQLEKPTTNIATRLIGTTAGLQAKLDVDGNPTFRIRGQSTLIREDDPQFPQPLARQPLVVVDGFPIQGDFSTINPNDVESITILKDAAAASIWGARSANGVIVVVTKAGRKGKPLKVELSVFTRMGKKFDLDYVNPLATSAQTVDYEKASFNKWSAQTVSNSLTSDIFKVWSPGTTALSEQFLGFITLAQRDAFLDQLKTQSNKQQISDFLLASPATQQYSLNLSGGSEKMTNNISLLFENNQSNFKKTDNKRYMLSYRTTANVFKWMDFNLGAMLQYTKGNNNGINNVSKVQSASPATYEEVFNGSNVNQLATIQGISPYEMLKNPDGSLTNIQQYYMPILQRFVPMNLFPYTDWTYNPIQEINNRDITSTQVNTRLQAGLTFKLMKGLTFDTRVQYELFNTHNRALNNENTFLVRNLVNTSSTWVRKAGAGIDTLKPNLPKGSILAQSRAKGESYNVRNQLSFNREFSKDHEINAIAGTETNNLITESVINPTTYGYNDETLITGLFPNGSGGTFRTLPNWLNSNQTFVYTPIFTYRTERFFSYYGNIAYTYKKKYTISGSYRTDAANLISDDPKYRYDPFWSVGGAWQLYKEDFFKNIANVDFLNIRLTYGYNGNVDRSTAFQPLINQAPTPNVYTNEQTATIASFGNPSLRWEKTGTWNLGIDYSIFGNKLFGKVDVYNKSGKDLIATISIPSVNGTTSQKLNNAAMTNRGIEIEIGTMLPIKGRDISWLGNLNFSYNKNKITKLFIANYVSSTLAAGGTGAYVEGQDANSMWRFEYAGVKDKQPMIKGPKGTLYDFGAFAPGDGREYMLNTGTSVAPYTLGFMNTFKIYDFNFSFIVTGKFGHVFQRQSFNYPPTWTTRVLPNAKITEVINGDPSKIVPLPMNDIEPRYYFWDRFHQSLSYLIENASHLRMQEVNLSYNLNQKLLSKINCSRLLVFVQGNDLFTVYANDAKEDPEYPVGTMNPRPKLTMGFKCEF